MEPKRTHKTFRYVAKTAWTTARRGVASAPGKPDVIVGSPPEFKGEPDNWAPEELLVASLNTCTMLTFFTLAQARGVGLEAYESDAEGLLEYREGTYRFTEITVRPRVTLASDAGLEAARQAMDNVEAHCFIANSLNAEINVIPDFVIAAPRG